MKNELITDSEEQRAWDFNRDNVEPFAEACAHRIYIEEYRKSLKAIIMKEHAELLIGAQEREAYADERYVGAQGSCIQRGTATSPERCREDQGRRMANGVRQQPMKG